MKPMHYIQVNTGLPSMCIIFAQDHTKRTTYLKEGKVFVLVDLDSKDGISWSLSKTSKSHLSVEKVHHWFLKTWNTIKKSNTYTVVNSLVMEFCFLNTRNSTFLVVFIIHCTHIYTLYIEVFCMQNTPVWTYKNRLSVGKKSIHKKF